MKTCPVCGATCFDDMEVCYGCMHDFARFGTPAPKQEVSDVSGKTLELFPVALRSPSATGPASRLQLLPEVQTSSADAAFSMQAPEGYRLVVSLQKVPAVA